MTDERKGRPSASKAERIYHCPGSHALELTQPEQDSDLASMGRKIHTAWETGDGAGLDEVEKQIFDDGSECLEMLIEHW